MSLILRVYIVIRRLGVPPDRTAQARRLCYNPAKLMTWSSRESVHRVLGYLTFLYTLVFLTVYLHLNKNYILIKLVNKIRQSKKMSKFYIFPYSITGGFTEISSFLSK